jgi:midasin (ATPase involved in ribosome maturation)
MCPFEQNGWTCFLQAGANLVVLNLSQQTDSSDLLGGFRPVEARDALAPLLPAFSDLVSSSLHTSASSSMCNCF